MTPFLSLVCILLVVSSGSSIVRKVSFHSDVPDVAPAKLMTMSKTPTPERLAWYVSPASREILVQIINKINEKSVELEYLDIPSNFLETLHESIMYFMIHAREPYSVVDGSDERIQQMADILVKSILVYDPERPENFIEQ